MIAHALHIIQNELDNHLNFGYSNIPIDTTEKVKLGNIAMGVGNSQPGAVEADKIIITLVNYKEEKTLKNQPNFVRNDATLRVTYENPPLFLNFTLLMTATHSAYQHALIDLSRVMRFFQSQQVFTPDNVSLSSLRPSVTDLDPLDHLESFKLMMDLHSPTLEETNHLWGTLGSKQYPFALYTMRAMELKYRSVQRESGLITEVLGDFVHKKPGS
jgi:hypothetical protein